MSYIRKFAQRARISRDTDKVQLCATAPNSFNTRCWPLRIGVLAFAALLAGCNKESIQTYSVPKEKAPSPPSALHWTVPAGWTEQPASGMRAGSFNVPGKDGQQADVSIIPLAGAAGSDLDNVNRWRAQVQLSPIAEDKLSSLAERTPIGTDEGMLYDMSGADAETSQPTRLLGAILAKGGTTWFIKMKGPESLVTEQKPAFQQFLKSVSFTSGATLNDRLTKASSPVAPAIPVPPAATPPTPGETSAGLPKWEVPPGWQTQAPSPMVLAKFAIAGSNSDKAEMSVTAFPGDVGGLPANVTRWRNQLGLGPIDTAELSKVTSTLDVNGVQATVVEMANPNAVPPARIVVVLVPHAGQTWFFKLLGSDGLVSREKSALIRFVQSVRFPNA